jgi:hypothetical protein
VRKFLPALLSQRTLAAKRVDLRLQMIGATGSAVDDEHPRALA